MTTNPHAPARGLRALAQARTRRLLRALSYWYRYEPFLAPAPVPHPCPRCGDVVANDDYGYTVSPPMPGLCFQCHRELSPSSPWRQ